MNHIKKKTSQNLFPTLYILIKGILLGMKSHLIALP